MEVKVGDGKGVGVDVGTNVGVTARLDVEEQASMVAKSNAEKDMIFELFILLLKNISSSGGLYCMRFC